MDSMIEQEVIQIMIDESIPDKFKPNMRKIIKKIFERLESNSYHIVYKSGDNFKFVSADSSEISINVNDADKLSGKITDITDFITMLHDV